jgi:hypothetical protein
MRVHVTVQQGLSLGTSAPDRDAEPTGRGGEHACGACGSTGHELEQISHGYGHFHVGTPKEARRRVLHAVAQGPLRMEHPIPSVEPGFNSRLLARSGNGDQGCKL